MVKGCTGQCVRLYVRGTIFGYKRSKSNQYETASLVQIEAVNTREVVAWYDVKITCDAASRDAASRDGERGGAADAGAARWNMFPEHVDHPNKLGLVPFGDTDFEEEVENKDMLVEEEYDGEDMPQMEWNRDNPNLNAGVVYKNMAELRNALTMYCIPSNNV
ncbi:60S ribosomal protein L35a-3 [Hordeum vulgare]|nr:60S ribosomal protein L35a-3 [Hordeum vulgare]